MQLHLLVAASLVCSEGRVPVALRVTDSAQAGIPGAEFRIGDAVVGAVLGRSDQEGSFQVCAPPNAVIWVNLAGFKPAKFVVNPKLKPKHRLILEVLDLGGV